MDDPTSLRNARRRPNSNVVAARSVIVGVAEFLDDHPTNLEQFRQHVRSQHNADRIRIALSVPMFAQTTEQLFLDDVDVETRLKQAAIKLQNRRVKRAIRHQLKQAREDPAWSNHRAAVALVKTLPKAALRRKNQVLRIALARFLLSKAGKSLNDAVGELAEFERILDEYEELERQREEIASGKIAEMHRRQRERSLRSEPEIDLRSPELILPGHREPQADRLIIVGRHQSGSLDAKSSVESTIAWPTDDWTIPGERPVIIRTTAPLAPKVKPSTPTPGVTIDASDSGHHTWSEARDEARLEREELDQPERLLLNREPSSRSHRKDWSQERDSSRSLGRDLNK